jgi:aerobic-type carbon monoxide dehydrogenase small subunit (CoxS/CutS family)
MTEEDKSKPKVSRRNFVKGAVAGLVVGAAATYGVTTTMMQPPRPEPTPLTMKYPTSGKLVSFKVNGTSVSKYIEAKWTLLEVLRRELGLKGTKNSCDYGECGVCSVIVDGKLKLACMMLAVEVEGKNIETIEGLAKGDSLHPIQEAFIQYPAFQCGFCTPGMIMTTKALLDENSRPTEDEIRRAISGNLCRCGEYARITVAIQKLAGT